ncbi:hypothetical protein I7I53_11716 [Histoplasma capsulatum var. duboisii H88]|uniref:Uncharacterized protein n=1 Tax=Ajellomyces capsulatus (strain H88) TaxID=544711 RepID=A0A8A1LTT5_AJEC8|nr:hypothetical protein I7I53_11716 [Histoplasma capsulatum var. duboisii H88]
MVKHQHSSRAAGRRLGRPGRAYEWLLMMMDSGEVSPEYIDPEEKKISADCGRVAGCLACVLFALNKYTIY